MKRHSRQISLYVPSLRGGGAERVIVRLANEFAERGYSVDLVLVKKKGKYLDDVSNQVSIVDLDTRRFLAAVPALVRYLRSARPDVLLSTIDSANVAAITAVEISRLDTKVVVRISNMLSSKEKELDHPKHKLVHWAAKRAYPAADHIIGVSDGVTKDVISHMGIDSRKVTTIYNPVLDKSLISSKNEPVEHPWFNDSKPVILGVGELSEQKDFGTLIQAVARIEREPLPRLVILGEGSKREALTRLAKREGILDRVELLGFVENPFSYMAKSDVFVLSSKWEGCPNVLIEAIACGGPVVSTDCPSGPREILDGGAIGSLVPTGNDVEMAEEITDVLCSNSDSSQYESYAEHYKVENISEKYLEVLL